MRLGRVRGGLSLRGYRAADARSKMALTGRSHYSGQGPNLTTEYLNFKLYIIDNFLQPIAKRHYELIRKNYYNFDFIIRRLNGFLAGAADENTRNEIILFKQIVELMRYSTEVKLSYKDAQEKLYGGQEAMRMLVETSRIILQAPYEIYHLLFGIPDKMKSVTHTKYEDYLILEIKKILAEYPGILFAEIKEKMKKWSYKFIDAVCGVSAEVLPPTLCDVSGGLEKAEWYDDPDKDYSFPPRPPELCCVPQPHTCCTPKLCCVPQSQKCCLPKLCCTATCGTKPLSCCVCKRPT